MRAQIAGHPPINVAPCNAYFQLWFEQHGGLGHITSNDVKGAFPLWLAWVDWLADETSAYDWFATLSLKQHHHFGRGVTFPLTEKDMGDTARRLFRMVDRKIYR